MRSADDTILTRYLLGDVSEEQQRWIERRLLTDDEYFDRLCKLEEDLIDCYVSGGLTPEDGVRFEQRFMSSPDRRESVEFARTLVAGVSANRILRPETAPRTNRAEFPRAAPLQIPTSRRRTRAVWLLPICAGLLLLIVSGWLLVQTLRLRSRLNQMQVEISTLQQSKERLAEEVSEQIARNSELARELELERARPAGIRRGTAKPRETNIDPVESNVVAVMLSPGLTRNWEPSQSVKLSPGITGVILTLALDETSYGSYRAELQTFDLKTVWSKTGLEIDESGGAVTVTVPAGLLTRSNYLVRLSGVGNDGSQKVLDNYYLKVMRQ